MPFDNARQKATALDNSRLFNVHRWSDYQQVNEAVDAIYRDLITEPDFRGCERLRKKHIKVIVLDLYANWLADPTRYAALSCSPNEYKRGSRYNKLHISFLTVQVVKALHRRGYVEFHPGFHNRELDVGRLSRMKATNRLIDLITNEFGIPPEAIQRWRDEECIILRDRVDDRIVNVEYEDTVRIQIMRKRLKEYNSLLGRTEICVLNAPPEGIPTTSETRFVYPNPAERFVRRIFNNGSWAEGGRFFGGWWQRIPSHWRVQISMNGSEGSTEIDYSGHHITLLYAKEGIDYWTEDEIDPYAIAGIEATERMRGLIKLLLLVAINSKDRTAALRAVRWKVLTESEEFDWVLEDDVPLEDLIDAFADRHQPIKHHLFSGAGLRLQKLDANIAEDVINHFTNNQIPLLCIHDSFVVQPEHADLLEEKMTTALRFATHRLDKNLIITPKLKKLTYMGAEIKKSSICPLK